MTSFLIPDQLRIRQFTDHMPVIGSFLEVGTGSGILARFCVQQGALRVVALDINPHAVANARKLAKGAEVLQSDLFDAVYEKFDNIIFAAPWSVGEISKPIDYALYDDGVVSRFLAEASDYLLPNGSIWLQYCDAFAENFEQLPNWINFGGFKVVNQWSYPTFGRLVKREVNVILYQLKAY